MVLLYDLSCNGVCIFVSSDEDVRSIEVFGCWSVVFECLDVRWVNGFVVLFNDPKLHFIPTNHDDGI